MEGPDASSLVIVLLSNSASFCPSLGRFIRNALAPAFYVTLVATKAAKLGHILNLQFTKTSTMQS
jgi:hypothetical protein